MIPKIKIKYKPKNNKEGVLYLFENKAQFEKCMATGCKLFSSKNTYDATDLVNNIELISSMAIEIWRLEKRIEKSKERCKGEGEASIAISDQVQRIKDIFVKQEIEIKEHTGEVYNDGLSLNVLHFDEIETIPEGIERIIETVKPSVYYKGKIIHNGEVIVGKHKAQ